MPKIFFTADSHYFHSNIIRFCNRPYENVEEMNNALIENWNSVVGEDDTVFHLGDFSFSHRKHENEIIFNELKGTKVLILGNHDKDAVTSLPWDAVHNYYEVRKHGDIDRICLFHYPMRSWNCAFHGSYHLYGHVHATIPDFNNSCDVGCDAFDYIPVDIETIKERVAQSVKTGGHL